MRCTPECVETEVTHTGGGGAEQGATGEAPQVCAQADGQAVGELAHLDVLRQPG